MRKREHLRVEIIITRDRTIVYKPRKRPPANRGSVAELIAFSPRSKKARLPVAV